jgi:hypothetical protein
MGVVILKERLENRLKIKEQIPMLDVVKYSIFYLQCDVIGLFNNLRRQSPIGDIGVFNYDQQQSNVN